MDDFTTHFVGMLPDGVFTDDQINEAVALWNQYFERFGIDESRRVQEFTALVSARVAGGSISIVAPTNKEAGFDWQ